MKNSKQMNYRVSVRPEAENDLKEAFSWYEDKRQGLGYDFLCKRSPNSVRKRIDSI